MKYFLHTKLNEVFAFEDDGSQDHLITADHQSVTEDQVKNIVLEKSGGLATSMRRRRNSLLDQLDKMLSNPLYWETLSDDYKNKLRQYRQLLLDVPQQQGFPDNVTWPDLPQNN